MTASLWALRWYEIVFVASAPVLAVFAGPVLGAVFGERARRNRAVLRRQRRAERMLVQRLRAW